MPESKVSKHRRSFQTSRPSQRLPHKTRFSTPCPTNGNFFCTRCTQPNAHQEQVEGLIIIFFSPNSSRAEWGSQFLLETVFVPQTARLLGFYWAFKNWILSRDDFALAYFVPHLVSHFVPHFFSHCVSHCSVRSCHDMALALSPTMSPTAL